MSWRYQVGTIIGLHLTDCWAEPQSDWLRRVLLRLCILQGHQQRQWNSVDETACAEVTATKMQDLVSVIYLHMLTRPTLERRKTFGHIRSINHNMIID